jgi:AAA+ ATPase superfamily predicted ATPase
MKFYDRETELAKLNQIASLSKKSSHMVILTGRRRVGKTELVKQFGKGRNDFLYLFVSKKKSHILIEDFQDILLEKVPLIKSATFATLGHFFTFLFDYLRKHPSVVVFDEFQNFEFVDPSVFSTLQNQWDTHKDEARCCLIFVGSIHALMQNIFESKKEPLFGRATAKLYLEPLDPISVAEILRDHHLDTVSGLPFFYGLFGGIPKYYFLLDRYGLFGKPHEETIRALFCEASAPLRDEGRELLIEEFGKNYFLYFSILQAVAGGETQMARIADKTGININSISKYLEELTTYYQVLERRIPVTEHKLGKKIGRYVVKDPALRFWFRYIFKNQTLIEIGDFQKLHSRIVDDLSTYICNSFEETVRALLIRRNSERILPFRFSRIGSFWTRRNDVEIDIVALNNEEGKILFGECKLAGKKFSLADGERLQAKARAVTWRAGRRKEFYALFSMEPVPAKSKTALAKNDVAVYDLRRLVE